MTTQVRIEITQAHNPVRVQVVGVDGTPRSPATILRDIGDSVTEYVHGTAQLRIEEVIDAVTTQPSVVTEMTTPTAAPSLALLANAQRAAYDMVDHFLRNNLDDGDYAEYSQALEMVYETQQRAALQAHPVAVGTVLGDFDNGTFVRQPVIEWHSPIRSGDKLYTAPPAAPAAVGWEVQYTHDGEASPWHKIEEQHLHLVRGNEGTKMRALYAAPPAASSVAADKGPWHVGTNGKDVFSDDSTVDVALRLSGDFRDDEHRRQYAEWLCEVLNYAAPPAAAPAGFVLVPVEPTTVQMNAGVDADNLTTDFETVRRIYLAMVAVTPQPAAAVTPVTWAELCNTFGQIYWRTSDSLDRMPLGRYYTAPQAATAVTPDARDAVEYYDAHRALLKAESHCREKSSAHIRGYRADQPGNNELLKSPCDKAWAEVDAAKERFSAAVRAMANAALAVSNPADAGEAK